MCHKPSLQRTNITDTMIQSTITLSPVLESHCQKIHAYYTRNPRCFKKRIRVLRWTQKIMEVLNLSARSRELVLFLIDRLLIDENFKRGRTELFCIACIYTIIKLEGDFTAPLKDFGEFVKGKLKITSRDILDQEFTILTCMPDDFARLVTLSEFNYALTNIVESRLRNAETQTARANDLCVDYYITNTLAGDVHVHDLIVSGYLACSNLNQKQQELVEFLKYVLETNFSVKTSLAPCRVRDLVARLNQFPEQNNAGCLCGK